MQKIIENFGTAILSAAAVVGIYAIVISYFKDGGIINDMVNGFMQSICG